MCEALAAKLASGGKTAWSDNWKSVYALASTIMERTMEEYVPSKARL